MAVFLIAVHPDEGLLTVVVAGTVYTGVLCALTIWSVGGPRQLKSKYLYLWSENGTPGVMWSPADE
jgi:hypothetical protein